MNSNGSRAIELLAIIIILTIATLISIPIVFNVVNEQKKEQNWKAIAEYGNNIEIALERYKLAHDGLITTNFNDLKEYLTIKDRIKCDNVEINEDSSISLSECYVDNEKVLNDKNESYDYNKKNKLS